MCERLKKNYNNLKKDCYIIKIINFTHLKATWVNVIILQIMVVSKMTPYSRWDTQWVGVNREGIQPMVLIFRIQLQEVQNWINFEQKHFQDSEHNLGKLKENCLSNHAYLPWEWRDLLAAGIQTDTGELIVNLTKIHQFSFQWTRSPSRASSSCKNS